MHKFVFICKKMSKLKNVEFSTYPHWKQRKRWKKSVFPQSYPHYPHKNICFRWITL